MGFTEGKIVFNQRNGVYYPGQTIFGKVIFDEINCKTCRGIYVVLQGFCKVRWTEYRSRGFDDVYESYEEYIHRKLYLVGGDGQKTTLVPGHYEFPFECALPGNLPSSFEGTVGHIRYGLKVVVDRALKFDQELTSPLTIISLTDWNMIPPAKVTVQASGCQTNNEQKRKIFIGNVPLREITKPLKNIQNIPGGPSTFRSRLRVTKQLRHHPEVARPTARYQPVPLLSNYNAYIPWRQSATHGYTYP